MDLARIFPPAEAIPFAGTVVRVRPLTLAQLAELQGWLGTVAPHPFDAAAEGWEVADGAGRRELARELIGPSFAWPVRLFSPAGDAILFGTAAGRLQLAALAIDGDFPAAELGRATEADWARLGRAAMGADPLRQILRAIEGDETDGAGAGEINWGAFVAAVIDQTGWTINQVGEHTFGQLAAVQSRGESNLPAIEPRDGETVAEAVSRRRALLGLPDEEPAADPAEMAADLARGADLMRRLASGQ